MKPENIKKVWEYYRGYQIRYRLGRSKYIVEAFNKNMNGDFSPSQFYNPIESRVHLIVQEYIKYLLEQETLEQAQQEQSSIDTHLKAPKETNNQVQTTAPFEKNQKEQPQDPKARKGRGKVVKVLDCEPHRNWHKVTRRSKKTHHKAITAHLPKEVYHLRLSG